MQKIRYILFFLLCFIAQKSFAQELENEWIQFSGLILSSDSLKPISYTTITVKGTHRGAIANQFGFFSLVVHKNEVLVFTSIGYRRSTFKVPDTITDNKYNIVKLMTSDTIYLAQAVIFPWQTFEQFKQSFVKTEVPIDLQERAMMNIELAKLKDKQGSMANDGAMNFRQQIYQQANRNYYAGQYPPNNFLNPFAWKKFFEAWQRGDFKQKKY